MCKERLYAIFSIVRSSVMGKLQHVQSKLQHVLLVFQQDSATAYTGKKTVNFLQKAKIKFWPKDVWPSNSPDLNALDYYFWERIVGKVCLKPHNSIITLKRSIKQAIDTVDKAEIINAVSRFRSRVEAVIANEGGHIEG